MSMTLTRYQGNTLAAVKAYFERCAFESPETAYKTVTAEGDVRLRLGADYGYSVPGELREAGADAKAYYVDGAEHEGNFWSPDVRGAIFAALTDMLSADGR